MKGYYVNYGYRGLMPDGKYYLFATEAEYEEAYAMQNPGDSRDFLFVTYRYLCPVRFWLRQAGADPFVSCD